MKAKKRKKKWVRFRHLFFRNILSLFLGPYSRIKYGIKIEKFKPEKNKKYLILYNHQTAFDQFFVGLTFKGKIYYVASEDIFSKGFVSKIIKFLVAPIPIKKQASDIRAVLDCMRVAKEGGTIAIAPEGNRTFDGRTMYINPAIVPLARKLNLPIALLRIEGGYGVHPRWADKVRRGKMRSYVSEVIEPEQYAAMSDSELHARIKDGLFVDENRVDGTYRSDCKAEYVERAIYVCPKCGLSSFESHGDTFECKKCGLTVEYGEDKRLTAVKGECNFEFLGDWYDYQNGYVNSIDTTAYTDKPTYVDDASFFEEIPYKSKNLLIENAKISLYGDKITVSGNDKEYIFPFSEVNFVTILGKNKVNVYHNKQVFQIKGGKSFNAVKYVNIFYRTNNILKEGENSQDEHYKFLGL